LSFVFVDVVLSTDNTTSTKRKDNKTMDHKTKQRKLKIEEEEQTIQQQQRERTIRHMVHKT
jgi:hypothetical protein